MRQLLAAGVLALALGMGMPPTPALADSPSVRVDPSFPPLLGPNPNVGRATPRSVIPDRRAYRSSPRYSRPAISCDSFGRCWQQVPSPYYRRGYQNWQGGYGARPPGWADDLPRRARDADRFLRPRSGVVCDVATSVCYKRGKVDKSETRALFGERAADRADDLRDRRGTGRLFVPERGVTCDAGKRACFDEGVPDYSLTRRYFGRQAADALD